jgi:hypothetical protein
MATISHEVSPSEPTTRSRAERLVPELWTSLAIAVIWVTVLLDAIFGPDIVTRGVAGDSAIVPSAIVISFFAFLATWVVARQGFRREDDR